MKELNKRILCGLAATVFVLSGSAAMQTSVFAVQEGSGAVQPSQSGQFYYTELADGTAAVLGFVNAGAAVNIPDKIEGKDVSSVSFEMVSAVDAALVETLTLRSDAAIGALGEMKNSPWYAALPADNGLVILNNTVIGVKQTRNDFDVSALGADFDGGRIYKKTPGAEDLTSVKTYAGAKTSISVPSAFVPGDFVQIRGYNYVDDGSGSGSTEYSGAVSVEVKKASDGYIASVEDDESEPGKKLVRLAIDPAWVNKVEIPDTVTAIAPYAFEDSSVTEVVIPDSVKIIGEKAFIGCDRMKSVTVPAAVTEIGDKAFGFVSADGEGQKTGNFKICCYRDSAAHTYAEASGVGFDLFDPLVIVSEGKCGASLDWKLDSDGVLTIEGEGSMTSSPWDRTAVRKVVIGEGVTSIKREAFADCAALTEVVMPDSLVTIGERAFASCGSLTEVTVPYFVKSIGGYAFGFDSDGNGMTSHINGFKLKGYAGTEGEKYADRQDVDFTAVEKVFTKDSVVKVCSDCGANSLNVQALDSFLTANAAVYSAADLKKIVDVLNNVSETYLAQKAKDTYNKKTWQLTEAERLAVIGSLGEDEKTAIHALLDAAAGELDISLTYGEDVDGYTLVGIAPVPAVQVVKMKPMYVIEKDEEPDLTKLAYTLTDGEGQLVCEGNADGDGNIAFARVPEADYKLLVSLEGYAPREIDYHRSDLGELKICKYGDVTGDGSIDNSDIARMQQKISHWTVSYIYDETARLDADEDADNDDLGKLQQFVSGWNVKLGRNNKA